MENYGSYHDLLLLLKMSAPSILMLFDHQVITIPRIPKYYFPRNARLGKKVPKIGGSRNPGNFRIFITPKKFTSFYSKDFLPKLIFLRKGVHHPKSGFPGVVAKFPDGFSFSGTPRILNFKPSGKSNSGTAKFIDLRLPF